MNLDGYVPVDARLRMALQKYPELKVQEEGWKHVQIAGQDFLECVVWVFTTPDDPRPTRGSVLEPFPGKTGFTRDSELMVGMTSALGRALGYLGLGIERGIASVDEIMARTTDPDLEVVRTDHRKRQQVGSRAKPAAERDQAIDRLVEEPIQPGGRRQTPTEKMMAFLERLNIERGNPLDGPEIARCAGDFDRCREKIDELQLLPKM